MQFLHFFQVLLLASFDMLVVMKLKFKFGVFDHPRDVFFHLVELIFLPFELIDESLFGQSEFFNQILFSLDRANR